MGVAKASSHLWHRRPGSCCCCCKVLCAQCSLSSSPPTLALKLVLYYIIGLITPDYIVIYFWKTQRHDLTQIKIQIHVTTHNISAESTFITPDSK